MRSTGRASRLFIRASLVYMVIGFALLAGAMLDLWLGFNPLAYTAMGGTMLSLVVGWLGQCAMGVLYGLRAEPPRRHLLTFVLVNVGLPVVILGQPVLAIRGGTAAGVVVAVGGLALLVGALNFASEIWPNP